MPLVAKCVKGAQILLTAIRAQFLVIRAITGHLLTALIAGERRKAMNSEEVLNASTDFIEMAAK